ncbi:MAG: NAD-dependent epimerase/dehydratase family protein, partial [Kiloniellales bacterium]|nr:NAD-dependent epimerase/dehydratase family protein [Kiloniellales bacterium]
LESSHVIPALIRKIHDAKAANQPTVTIWGSGRPLREFLHVDDCADALVHLLKHYSGESQVNIGYGEDVSIEQLARSVAAVIGYEGGFSFDTSKPDGTPRKLLDSGRLRQLGWRPKIDLETGLRQTYAWLLEQGDAFRGR